MADIEAGLSDLVAVIREREITSIAIPPLGCGNGGLDWRDVQPRIYKALEPLASSVDARVFPPAGAPAVGRQPNAESRPNLTPARAALLALMREYERMTFEPPSLIAIQKLAYFLQASGQPLRLTFVPHTYGPYADDLRKSLRALEGHFITGFGDGSMPVTRADPIEVRADVEDALTKFIDSDPQTKQRISDVLDGINGFESTYGLELLATVHWVMSHDAKARDSIDRAHEQIQIWNPRKRSLFTRPHVASAWQTLRDREMVPSS